MGTCPSAHEPDFPANSRRSGCEPNSGSAILIGIAPWLLIFVIFYVLMIRPQQQRVKQHQAAIAAIKKGDEVVTGGGIRGRVTKVSDDEAEIEISQGVRVRVIKSTLSQVLSGTSKPAND
ncbi:preprotein translocase subunit YajC [Sphingomonas daechungensis]|uniref:Sec translocon accessory complex subunit YajC n=1 Tax=Sphingomonas daechungensis TaxID=1176646 RepID=A0ABX6T3X4_9SPHN|nr:preprotein translocase subunit YajC [Sphingomonas daechungensis]